MLKGYWATNAVWLPWNAIYIAAFEASKVCVKAFSAPMPVLGAAALPVATGQCNLTEHVILPRAICNLRSASEFASRSRMNPLVQARVARALAADPLPAWSIAACSVSSSSLAVVCTHPADIVKTRLQVRGPTA